MEKIDVLFCGIGGQGVLKASELCGLAAMYSGWHVKKSEVHGMAQRGGSVVSHLRIGRCVYSPVIPHRGADFIVPLDENETVRYAYYVNDKTKDLSRWIAEGRKAVSRPFLINTFMAGVLSAFLPIKEAEWDKAIESAFKDRLPEENRDAFMKGRRSAL